MHIGIMSDMAVGVHPSGADVWWNPERFAKGATVGAPPDMFNQQGQNWSQPPLSPINLETTGYEAYRNMVHGMFARAGAVRIDHILGLFRLWWIPENRSAMDGAYVYYDSDIMLGVLAIEASRAGGVVVGEDLAWCRTMWPIPCRATVFSVAPLNGSSSATACSAPPPSGVRMHWPP